jgi:hypothetical protein
MPRPLHQSASRTSSIVTGALSTSGARSDGHDAIADFRNEGDTDQNRQGRWNQQSARRKRSAAAMGISDRKIRRQGTRQEHDRHRRRIFIDVRRAIFLSANLTRPISVTQTPIIVAETGRM